MTMTIPQAINTILLLAAAAALLPIGALCLECLAALWPGRRRRVGWVKRSVAPPITENSRWGCASLDPPYANATSEDAPSRPRAAVLIPAHDEQLVIEHTLQAIIPTLSAADRVLVVADNCTDRTAELARRAGAEVVERNDPPRRGKGYALQRGFRHLADDPPDVVVAIDADCLPEPGAIDLLAHCAWREHRPVQARNLTDRRLANGPIEAVSILANRVTNLVRPLGLMRLGAPCRMTGTGMAIPWPLVKEADPAGGNLVEDMQLGIDLALRGHLPLFCPEAGVSSAMPESYRAFASQRTRWEHGHLRAALRQVPRLLWAALRRRSWPLMAMAVDLSIPPLTLLVAIWSALAVLSCLAWRLGASGLPAVLLAGGGVALAVSLGAAWTVFCRRQVPPRALAAVPLYMLCKLPIYARFLFHRQNSWVRTERDSPDPISHAPHNLGYTLGDEIRSHNHGEERDRTGRKAGTAPIIRSGRTH
ncbi:MAG: glycosyltransferase [Planctomycetes bacterium]|nr:glycosyltransferase [Planctomycetota bacterium]MBU4400698.1 glycosyltransferase [Planctomycetota bacterium]